MDLEEIKSMTKLRSYVGDPPVHKQEAGTTQKLDITDILAVPHQLQGG